LTQQAEIGSCRGNPSHPKRTKAERNEAKNEITESWKGTFDKGM